jgi:hypothetical protein
MIHTSETALNPVAGEASIGAAGGRGALLAGVGAIAFSVSTVVAIIAANAPGSNYTASDVSDYLAKGHRIAVIVVMHLALLGVVGLICLLAHLRDTVSVVPENRNAADIVWGTGIAAAASFALGWAVVGGQVIAHLEGGSGLVIAPPVTHLIGELGVVFIFGSGAILLGCAMIVAMLSSRTMFPAWLRRLTIVAGVCGIAGLAFFPFFVLMVWGVVMGVWLLRAGRAAQHKPAFAGASITSRAHPD